MDDVYTRRQMVLAALIISLCLVVLAYRQGSYAKNIGAPPVPVVSAPSPFIEEKDSDSDGIPDWQEPLIEAAGGESATTPVAVLSSEPKTASDAVGERLISQYLFLKNSNAYTKERGTQLGETLASSLHVDIPFKPYTLADLRILADGSGRGFDRDGKKDRSDVQANRDAVRIAMEPLLAFTDAELGIYAQFIDTKNPIYLETLTKRAQIYEEVAERLRKEVVPDSGADIYLAAINAMRFYAATMDTLVRYSNDPIASLSLLRKFSEAERYLTETMNALSTYYNTHIE